ncbi:hypothetical protein HK100_004512, partial [Physocladia obscura]
MPTTATTLPEHIVFCIDNSIDGVMFLKTGNADDSRLAATKLLAKRFIAIKSRIAAASASHQ